MNPVDFNRVSQSWFHTEHFFWWRITFFPHSARLTWWSKRAKYEINNKGTSISLDEGIDTDIFCHAGFQSFADECYMQVTMKKTFTQAQEYCQSRGAKLIESMKSLSPKSVAKIYFKLTMEMNWSILFVLPSY